MISLLTELYNLIYSAASGRVYFETAEDEATFPYAVYRLPTSTSIGNNDYARQDFILEIDVWDNVPDATRIETLADRIDVAINNQRVRTNLVALKIYRIGRLNIPDPNSDIRRRQLRYRVATYLS